MDPSLISESIQRADRHSHSGGGLIPTQYEVHEYDLLYY